MASKTLAALLLGFLFVLPGTVPAQKADSEKSATETREERKKKRQGAAKSANAPGKASSGSLDPTKAWEGIVRIENSKTVNDYRAPWNGGRPSGGTGTGFLVGENLFMTNAHVVSDSSRLVIRKVGRPEPYLAEIVHVAHDCDLALVRLLDPAPFEGMAPLEIGDVPRLDTEVIVVGYPIGGERMSVTRGVVSRIDFRPYAHSGIDSHLAIQIDAAINPGNSGGPVIQGDRVVGVAFQGFSGSVAQNVGYMIPTPVVKRFLEDVEDGEYDHYVDLAISDMAIQNPAQVKALGLPNAEQGVLVCAVDSAGSAAGKVEVGDVILAIDGNPVASNGLISLDGELVEMTEVVERKFAGDEISLLLWRDGKKMKRKLQLKRLTHYLMRGIRYDVRPRFVIHAGLVFQPLNRNLVTAHKIDNQVANYWFNFFTSDELYKLKPEPVVLTTVLPDAINTHVNGYVHSIVDEIDGRKITTLADCAAALDGAIGEFIVIKLVEQGRPVVLNRKAAKEAHQRIVQSYSIAEDRFLGEEPAAAPSE